MIGDLLLRREERDRSKRNRVFGRRNRAAATGLQRVADYQDVRCGGHQFRLGPIQAQVVRALHEAARRGEAWQSGKAILSAADSKLKMSDVFKSRNSGAP